MDCFFKEYLKLERIGTTSVLSKHMGLFLKNMGLWIFSMFSFSCLSMWYLSYRMVSTGFRVSWWCLFWEATMTRRFMFETCPENGLFSLSNSSRRISWPLVFFQIRMLAGWWQSSEVHLMRNDVKNDGRWSGFLSGYHFLRFPVEKASQRCRTIFQSLGFETEIVWDAKKRLERSMTSVIIISFFFV